MSSTWGEKVKISIFGESHGEAIGVTIDGLPAGERINLYELRMQVARRAPGGVIGSTPRSEADNFKILSGMLDDVTTGAPICCVIENHNTRSGDYSGLMTTPRPSHADYTAFVHYEGHNDIRGGGHFSGRLTAPLTIAGAFCRQILSNNGIDIGAHIYSIGEVRDTPFDMENVDKEQLKDLNTEKFCVIDDEAREIMQAEITKAREEGDSIGGIIECAAVGLPVGMGEPMFGGVESRIASILYGIPAVKGVEFGAGFEISKMRGSKANDTMYYDDGKVRTRYNNNGGILGGITNGMPLILRVAIKPTPSIAKEQDTVDLQTKENVRLSIKGRHDSCIAVRAVPVVESAVAVALLDMLL
ncbi:MAG: chorismate synthase [Clostridiales bacterium]|nr:chorismate synthase [Clostridiales bacterium]